MSLGGDVEQNKVFVDIFVCFLGGLGLLLHGVVM